MSWRRSGNVRTSKSCTVSCDSGIPSSAVASRTSRASVSGGKPVRQRPRRDREGDVPHLAARLDEAGHRAPAAELAVVRVRREDERSLPGFDHRECISGEPRPARALAAHAAEPDAASPAAALGLARPWPTSRLSSVRSARRSSLDRGAAGRSSSPASGLIVLAEAVLAVSGPSRPSPPRRAALGLVGLIGLAAFGYVFVRRPELVPLAILIAAPLRMPLDFGAAHRFYVGLPQGGETGRLLPLYGVVAAAAARARVAAPAGAGDRRRRSPREIALPLGALVVVRVALGAVVVGGRVRAEPAAVLPPPLRRPRRRRRARAVPRLDAAGDGDRRRRARSGVRLDRARRGGDAPARLLHALRPGRERVLELLPRHLALPRPEPVRPPPRARDRDRADGRLVPEARDRARDG